MTGNGLCMFIPPINMVMTGRWFMALFYPHFPGWLRDDFLLRLHWAQILDALRDDIVIFQVSWSVTGKRKNSGCDGKIIEVNDGFPIAMLIREGNRKFITNLWKSRYDGMTTRDEQPACNWVTPTGGAVSSSGTGYSEPCLRLKVSPSGKFHKAHVNTRSIYVLVDVARKHVSTLWILKLRLVRITWRFPIPRRTPIQT
jgi:hypothetical protein